MDQLTGILLRMDLPEERVIILNKANLQWLLRNIGIKETNRNHEDFEEAMRLIKVRLKELG